MKQILGIFVKDARHQWLEILISFAAILTLAFTYHSRWKTDAGLYTVSFSMFGLASRLPDLLIFFIVPLSWWLLTSRAIHEEKLVGDRQFWITRPYEWKKLLAAKLLFLAVFLYVPLFMAQCVILAQAGFSPFHFLPGLLYDSLLFIVVTVLPLVVLATVTRNFARMTLAMLGVAGSLIAVAWLASNAPPGRVALPYGTEIGFVLALCLCVAVIVVQYARHGIKIAWTLLALVLVVFGVCAMGGAPSDAAMNQTYAPGQPAVAAAQFSYRDQPESTPSAYVTRNNNWVGISIPVSVSGVADGTITIPDDLRVTLEAPGGAHWTSVWQAVSMEKFFPGENSATAEFTMPRAVYDDLKGKPLNVQVVFALTQARAGNVRQFALGRDEFAVLGVGICTPITQYAERPDEIRGVACRAPLRQPELTFVRSAWSTAPCRTTPPDADDRVESAAWMGSLERATVEFGIAPVWSSPVGLTNQVVMERNRPVNIRHFCPGTPITFTEYALSTRTQATLWIKNLQLPQLIAGQLTVMGHE